MDDPFPVDMLPAIERFFKDTHPKLRTGADVYSEVFTSPFFPLQRKRETSEMVKIGRQANPKTVMEIGADKSGGFYHWCQSYELKRAIGCEARGTPYASLFEKNFPDIDFLWTKDSTTRESIDTVSEFLDLFETKIDVLFIDGGKTQFFTDFRNYLPLMAPTGIVFMHDIRDPHPWEAFLRVKNYGFRTREIIDISEYTSVKAMNAPPRNDWEGWLLHWKGQSCGVGVIFLDGRTTL